MARTDRIVQAAYGLLGRPVVGFLGGMAIAALIAPPPETDARMRSEPLHGERAENAVALTIPQGELSSTLTITDPTGRRPLATWTHWNDGQIGGSVPRGDGAGLAFRIDLQGVVRMDWIGTVHETHFKMNPDGTTETSMEPRERIRAGPE